jgi:hypothetical protein
MHNEISMQSHSLFVPAWTSSLSRPVIATSAATRESTSGGRPSCTQKWSITAIGQRTSLRASRAEPSRRAGTEECSNARATPQLDPRLCRRRDTPRRGLLSRVRAPADKVSCSHATSDPQPGSCGIAGQWLDPRFARCGGRRPIVDVGVSRAQEEGQPMARPASRPGAWCQARLDDVTMLGDIGDRASL